MKAPLIPFLLVATVLPAAESQTPSASDSALKYRDLIRATKTPKSLSAQFATLCGFSAAMDAEVKRSGPHAIQYVNYYRSESAVQPATGAWPVGSVLVKEKLGFDFKGGAAQPTAIAGMIKRAAGTAPKTGDWEFFWSENGKLSQKSMAHCAGCHSGAARDFVFTDFAALAAAKDKK